MKRITNPDNNMWRSADPPQRDGARGSPHRRRWTESDRPGTRIVGQVWKCFPTEFETNQ